VFWLSLVYNLRKVTNCYTLFFTMWLDEVGEVVEMFRSSFPLSFLFFIPLLVMMSPITPADAAHDFAVYRMQQYDIQGAAHGILRTNSFDTFLIT